MPQRRLEVAAWILGLRCVASLLAPPQDDEAMGVFANRQDMPSVNESDPSKLPRQGYVPRGLARLVAAASSGFSGQTCFG